MKAKLRTKINQLIPVERLAVLVAQTATQDIVKQAGATKRLWETYILVVELEFGSQMDEQKERDAVTTMGLTCARLDLLLQENGTETRRGDAMRVGLGEGTGDMERFNSAYAKAISAGRK